MTKKKRILAIFLILLGVLITLFFGIKTIHAFRRMHDRGPFGKPPAASQTDVSLIRDWMTIPYIAHAYGVPERMLFKTLGVPENEARAKSLIEINKQYFPEQDSFVIAQIQQAILAFQRRFPRPPTPETPFTHPAATP